MSVSVQIGLLMAVATAFFAIVGFLYKHRGAVGSPPVEWKRPVRTSLALFRNRWYVLGIVIAIGSWGFHVAALALAPMSVVQSVLAGGVVLLAARMCGVAVVLERDPQLRPGQIEAIELATRRREQDEVDLRKREAELNDEHADPALGR